MVVHSGKYEFLEAGEFDQTYRYVPDIIVIPEFRKIAETYKANFDRITALHELPIQLIAWAEHLAMCAAKIRVQHGLAADDKSKDPDPIVGQAIHSEFLRTAAAVGDARRYGASKLDGMLEWEEQAGHSDHEAILGSQALFSAMIIAAYVALENLAADLWVEALNKRDSLALNWMKHNDKKQYGFDTFGSGLNLSGKMGSVLQQTRKVTFEKWDDIKSAYHAAFDGQLDHVFLPPGPIYIAEKTRHLFAHRGGIIDQKFKDEMQSHSEFAGAIVGERLRLTGPVVRDRVNACVSCGANLLKETNAWALANP